MAKKKPVKTAKDHGRELVKKVNKTVKTLPKDPRLNHEANVKRMVERYGTDCKWVEAEMHLTYDEMIKYIGEQCEEYEPLCCVCSSWLKWNKTGKVDITFERDELLKIM